MNRLRRCASTSIAIVFFLFTAVVAWAAITGSISGVITDPSGALTPGVTVVVTSQSTGAKHTTVTDSKGFYSVPALDVDNYDVSASQAGLPGLFGARRKSRCQFSSPHRYLFASWRGK